MVISPNQNMKFLLSLVLGCAALIGLLLFIPIAPLPSFLLLLLRDIQLQLCSLTVSTVPGRSNLKEKGLRLTAAEVSVHHGETAQFTRVFGGTCLHNSRPGRREGGKEAEEGEGSYQGLDITSKVPSLVICL